ncbi:MAG TPA: SRPBCC domain-containing protein [Mesorhizobium sp.]|jgi:uncharacterized protein YndB with AHSA1/START domain|nr:SRPBCC domain-containing protein [Mesorhizobium sp.]
MMAETQALEQEYELAEPPAKVWRALTEPELVARWLRPNPSQVDGDEEDTECSLLDTEPGWRVSYRWRDGALDGVVTFSIAPNASGGTRLKLVHSAGSLAPVALAGSAWTAPRPTPANSNRPLLRLAA